MKMAELKPELNYSIIVVTYNGLLDNIKCFDSIFKHTNNFELVVVDNGSTDGTVEYLHYLQKKYLAQVKIILNPENQNFGPANNQGAEVSQGKYLIFLNSDTIVTPTWAEKLRECSESEEKIVMVGPMSNSSNGRQQTPDVDVTNLDYNSMLYMEKNYKSWFEAGILFGWCLFVKRSFLLDEPFVFDPIFKNSYEDNDLCLRARLKGYKLMIDKGTFIFHKGQATFKREWNSDFFKKYIENGKQNQLLFYDKWKPKEKQKVIAVYRIANCEKYIAQSLNVTSKYVDEIICLFARSKDKTKEIALSYDKVTDWDDWKEQEHPLNESEERNWLLQRAIERGADWIISIDGDEIYEDKFWENLHHYTHNPNPQIFGYWCNWRTIWDKDKDGNELYRVDGIFGGFQNYRFFKVLPGMKIESNDSLFNHHCGSAPILPPENLKWLNVRVKHLGYDTEEQRQMKYNFYRSVDPYPMAKHVGNTDYHHLIDRNVVLKRYKPSNKLSLMSVVKNEGDLIFSMLENVERIVDEFVIINHNSTDNTLEEIKRFEKIYGREVKIFTKTFTEDENGMILNYSEAKNFGKSQCTGQWILNMDADENWDAGQVSNLFGFIDEECDGFLVTVINYLAPPKGPKPEDNVFAVSEAIRLYRNIDELFYTGLVHESLEDACTVRALNGKGHILHSPIQLHHRGYLKKKDRVREKVDRYALINKKQFELSGCKDPRPLFNLALHYFNDQQPEQGMDFYEKALALSPKFWRARQNIAYHFLDKAKEELKKAVEDMPEIYKKNNKINEILNFLDKFEFKIKKVA